jgi:hypothetical protein
VFRDIKQVGYRKVLDEKPGWKMVEVEQCGELRVSMGCSCKGMAAMSRVLVYGKVSEEGFREGYAGLAGQGLRVRVWSRALGLRVYGRGLEEGFREAHAGLASGWKWWGWSSAEICWSDGLAF